MSGRHVCATVRLAAWIAALVVALRLLLATGAGVSSIPVTSWDDLAGWAADTPPTEMTVALLRLVALVATCYLVAVTVLAVAVRLVRVRGLVDAVDRISPRVVRRVVSGGGGVGLLLGGLVTSLPMPDLATHPTRHSVTSAPAAPPGSPAAPAGAPAVSTATMSRVPAATATMARVDPAPDTGSLVSATMTRVVDAPGSADPVPAQATMARVDPAADTSTAASVTMPRAAGAPHAVAPVATPPVPEIDAASWIVEPGDSLWGIAEEVTAAADGSRPGDRAVTRYWLRLIDANVDRLVDPDNPDLLVPGQHLVVPPATGG